MLISYDLLKPFALAAQRESFSQAAQARGVTTSAVSQQVRTLEGQLGFALFERIGRRVRVTPAAAELQRTVTAAFKLLDDGLAATARDFGVIAGDIAIGAPRSFAQHWLNPRIAAMCRRHPGLAVRLSYGVPSQLERELQDGALDFAVLVRAPALDHLTVEKIAVESFTAVAAPEYLQNEGTPRSLSDYLGHRYLIFDSDRAMHDPWWRSHFGRKAAPANHIACEAASLEALLDLCMQGLGICVLPEYLVRESVRSRRLVELTPEQGKRATPQNVIYLAWRTNTVNTHRFNEVRSTLLANR